MPKNVFVYYKWYKLFEIPRKRKYLLLFTKKRNGNLDSETVVEYSRTYRTYDLYELMSL